MTITLHHIHGSLKGTTQSFDLHEGGSVVCGRLPASDVAFDPLQDIKASGRHARILRQGNRYLLEDLRSSNGTFVNGLRVQGTPLMLNTDDILEFGGGGPKARISFGVSVSTDTASVDNAAFAASSTLPLSPIPSAAPPRPTMPAKPIGSRHKPSPVDASALTVEAESPGEGDMPTAPHIALDDAAQETLPEMLPQPSPPTALAINPTTGPITAPLTPATDDSPSPVGANTVALMIGKAQREGSRRIMTLFGVLVSVMLLTIFVLAIFVVRSKQTETQISQAQSALDETHSDLIEAQKSLREAQSELALTQARLRDLDAQKALDEAERNRLIARLNAASISQPTPKAASITTLRADISPASRAQFLSEQQHLAASQTQVSTDLTLRYGDALFSLAIEIPQTPSAPAKTTHFCSAFAIHSDGWLATNAHCIATIRTALAAAKASPEAPTPLALAIGNSAPLSDLAPSFPIDLDNLHPHPLYTDATSPDIALLKVTLPPALRLTTALLASPDEALSIQPTQPVYVIGFSGPTAANTPPRAVPYCGLIALLTDSKQLSAPPPLQHILWHTALSGDGSTPGANGAPLFDSKGRVIAINNSDLRIDHILSADGTPEPVQAIYAVQALNFGVRIDLLHDLIARHNIDLPRITTPPSP